MQAAGRHGPHEGQGKIYTQREGRPVEFDYRYHQNESGLFHGSISAWEPDEADMGLVAYMSRAMPTRQAMIEWIFQKAEKLTANEE
jgi:hypothetical protein